MGKSGDARGMLGKPDVNILLYSYILYDVNGNARGARGMLGNARGMLGKIDVNILLYSYILQDMIANARGKSRRECLIYCTIHVEYPTSMENLMYCQIHVQKCRRDSLST